MNAPAPIINALNLNVAASPYQALIGVGGIGTGSFVALQGNHTLGREESRAVRFLDNRDYCKLHIITHYVKTLLGPEFATILIGKVGDDAIGHRLIAEMAATGLDTRYVEIYPGLQTMNSICFLYPDGTGGNLTTDDSACSHVDAAFVERATDMFEQYAGRGIALAAPEVPLAARQRLLELGTTHRFLRAATFVSGEMEQVLRDDLLPLIDLLSINLDEAAALTGRSAEDLPPEAIIDAALETLLERNPGLTVFITAGKRGNWSWASDTLQHVPAIPVEPVSTAGAGDSFLASLIAGYVAQLPLAEAQQLATLVAALSVTSPHTIHPDLNRPALAAFAAERQLPLPERIRALLSDPANLA